MAEQIRMSDIARRLGISTVSVSKALAGEKGVSEETRQRVREMAEEMGYVGPMRHRAGVKQSHVLGVLIPSRYLDATETFYWRLYQDVVQQAAQRGCLVLLEMLDDAQASECAMPRLVAENRAEGLILLGRPPFDYAGRMRQRWPRPVVYLDFCAPEANMDAVLSNNMYGMSALTEYLIRRGHREIGFVGTLQATDSINDRFLGYCRALLRNGIPFRSDWCLDDRDTETGSTFEIRLPEQLPTAFVCNCDMTAAQMIAQLKKSGRRVPEDISVVGFDDYLPAGITTIPLTTWAADTEEMARLAVRTLIKRILGEPVHSPQQITNGRLVLRDSVRSLE